MCPVMAKDIVEQLFCCNFSSSSILIKIARLVTLLARSPGGEIVYQAAITAPACSQFSGRSETTCCTEAQ